MARWLVLIALVLASLTPARAEEVLRVGDQRGNARALMEATGVLDGLPTGWNGASFRRPPRCWKR